jgi:hypothetical protein
MILGIRSEVGAPAKALPQETAPDSEEQPIT